MFLDASAIVAILADEPEAATLAARLARADQAFTSPIAVFEATLGLARIAGTTVAVVSGLLDRFIAQYRIETMPITEDIARGALDAFVRFGRGNHPARLNMGDCFAYGCARARGLPLLFKGEDFGLTDIASG